VFKSRVACPDRIPDAAPEKAPASDRVNGGRFTATVVPDPDPPAAGSCPGGAPTPFGLCVFDFRSQTVMFDSGPLAVDDPGVVAIPEGFEDLVKVFEKHRWLTS
jgi:hypothetical protein